ncbi:MAG: hypothetical protein ACR2JK_08605 [Geodermatophilaceae bacterium]
MRTAAVDRIRLGHVGTGDGQYLLMPSMRAGPSERARGAWGRVEAELFTVIGRDVRQEEADYHSYLRWL